MEVVMRQGPAYGVARLNLAPNEPVRVESGAMMTMSPGVTLESKAEGGIMKSLKRAALGGESFFVSTYTAPPSGGFVDVAARLPGDITNITSFFPAATGLVNGNGNGRIDGTEGVQLIWLGRRSIPGIEPGRTVKVRGRVAIRDGRKVIYNPDYDLLPAHA